MTTLIEQKQTTEAQERHDESASDLFLRQLSACGVDYFFANGGTDFPPIAEAFARAAEHGAEVPRPMVIPHENVAVSMAHGVYMTTGRPQAVMVHVNVGTANTVNAVLNASRDETPVLLFAGRSPYSETGRHGTRTRYIHWAQEMFDQGGMLREAVKWDYELHLPEQAADLVARAYQVAMTSPRGPVYATLPRDVLADPIRVSRPDSGRRPAPAVPHPQPDDIRRLADWIATAERPLIITQGAGRTKAGFDALARVAERFAIPVVSFHPRFLNIAADHPMNLGFQPGELLARADLVIALEADVPWIPNLESPPDGCRIVQIGEDPSFTRYPMRSFPTDLGITGDAATVLDAVERRLTGHDALDEGRIAARGAVLRTQSRALAAKRLTPDAVPPGSAIGPEWLSACIAEAVGPGALIVNEYPLRLEHCPQTMSGSYFGLSAAGGLGWGLGAALGAKLANPDRLVVATLGDGAYMFANPTASHWVAEAHDLPVLTIIFNNQLYGAVRNATMAMYKTGVAARNGGRMLADLSPAPAYEKLVEASGGAGFRVERPEDLRETLRRAVAVVTGERRQALVNVLCDY
ncbi:thiamine pyrophosphate-requiring protein [Azospirillum sp. OGB3]|uniref:thiamine pyrophosphate-requiring protein n=1 Tax=Azospirillum sp. OGB3 TaxID=2587012 RepID=UPI001605E385